MTVLPFTRADAHGRGITDDMLRGPRFRRIYPGVYVPTAAPDTLRTRASAALLVVPGGVLSHETAATLRELPVPVTDVVHVTVGATSRRRLPGLVVHRARRERDSWHGLPLTTPADTYLDLAASVSLVDLVVLGDAMVRRRLASPAQLMTAAAGTSRRGVERARAAATLVRPNVDSPPETRLRLLLVGAGLPEPVAGFVIHDDDGGWVAAVDLAYPAYRIALEYDGDVHRVTRRKWRTDNTKRELLRALGWTVLVFTGDDLMRPRQTVRRVVDATRAAGCGAAVLGAIDPRYR